MADASPRRRAAVLALLVVLVLCVSLSQTHDRNGRSASSAASKAVEGRSSLAARDDDLSDEELLQLVSTYQSFPRITAEPHRMNPPAAGACIIFGPKHVHGNRYCDIFVTDDGLETIQSGEGTYPPGEMVVKVKYYDSERRELELFTVMRKMPRGYSSQHGDWEFSVLDAGLRHVLARGRLESCIQCHDEYAATDFVTRTYLQK